MKLSDVGKYIKSNKKSLKMALTTGTIACLPEQVLFMALLFALIVVTDYKVFLDAQFLESSMHFLLH